ncbi:MAG: hypothetical protein PHY44_05740 [Lachnospiraceae bacterium]|nr:hypothetical protein [Lachnospiraceae bacterium]
MKIDNKSIQRLNKINLKKQKRLKVKNPRMRRVSNALHNHPRKEYLLDFLNDCSKELIPYRLLEMAFEMLTDDYDDMTRTRFTNSKYKELSLSVWEADCVFWQGILMRRVFLDTTFGRRHSTLHLKEIQKWQNFCEFQNTRNENGGNSNRTIQDNFSSLNSNNVFKGIFYLEKKKIKYVTTFYPKLTMLLIQTLKKSPFIKNNYSSFSYDQTIAFYKNLFSKYFTPYDNTSYYQEETKLLKEEALNYFEGICNTYTKLTLFNMAILNTNDLESEHAYKKLYIRETMDTILSEYSYLGGKKLFERYLKKILEDKTREDIEERHYSFNNQFLLLSSRLYEKFSSNYGKLLNNYYPKIYNWIDETFFQDLEKSFEVIDKQWPSEFGLIRGIPLTPKEMEYFKEIKNISPKKFIQIPTRRISRLKVRANFFKFNLKFKHMAVKKGNHLKSWHRL